jgi:hypothetical protein
MKKNNFLPPGEYNVEATWKGTYLIEEDEELTEMEVVDNFLPMSELIDWSVKRQ